MTNQENPFAGQGPVVLDIGDGVGALIVTMPAAMVGLEVEIIPSGTDRRRDRHGHPHQNGAHGHGDDHGHRHDHGHPHDHGPDGHMHPETAPPHVAVVARPLPDGSTVHSLVYGELTDGTYDLYVRPDGVVRLTATVRGGQVTLADWPDLVTV